MSEPLFIPGWQDADAKGCWELAIAMKRERLKLVRLIRRRAAE